MKNKTSFFSRSILFSAAIVFVCILVSFSFENISKEALAAASSTLYLDPATHSTTINQDFTINAMVNPGGNQLTAVVLDITFDPAVLRLDGISMAGSAFSLPLQAASINNANGTASITVGVPMASPIVPVTAVSNVATLSFHSLAEASSSSVTITNSSLASALDNGSEDALMARNGAAITIAGATYGNADFANLVTDWLQVGSSQTDINADGVVNTRDLGIMMSNWQ